MTQFLALGSGAPPPKDPEEGCKHVDCWLRVPYLLPDAVLYDKVDPGDILQGKPEKISIKMVRNAKLPSGKKVPLRALELSSFSFDALSPLPFREFRAAIRFARLAK